MKTTQLLAHGGPELVVLVFAWLLLLNLLAVVSCVAARRKRRVVALSCGGLGIGLGFYLLRAYEFRFPDGLDSFLAWLALVCNAVGICIALFPRR
jgi:hypothetical protein